ncbi:hypothetical protein JCM11491_001118 [Sporobolomyces phaffii]
MHSFASLTPELQRRIVCLVKAQDEAFLSRSSAETTKTETTYGHGIAKLSLCSKSLRKLCVGVLFESREAVQSMSLLPRALASLPNPSLAVRELTLRKPITLVRELPRLVDRYPNLTRLNLETTWTFFDHVFPQPGQDQERAARDQARSRARRRHSRADRRREAELYDSGDSCDCTDEDDEDDDDEYGDEEDESEEETTRVDYISGLDAFTALGSRLTSLSIGTARHLDQLTAALEKINPASLKKLSFGIAQWDKSRDRQYQREVSSSRAFVKALDRFAKLEELTFGYDQRLVETFSTHKFRFAKTLRRLDLRPAQVDMQVFVWLGQGFVALESLKITCHRDRAIGLRERVSLPKLKELYVSTGVGSESGIHDNLAKTLQSFASAPRLRVVTIALDLNDDEGSYFDGFGASELVPILAPLCSTSTFPALERVVFARGTLDCLDGGIATATSDDLFPDRPALTIAFEDRGVRVIESPFSRERWISSYTSTEPERQRFYLDESRKILEWGLAHVNQVGSTMDALSLMFALKHLGEIKLRQEE